MFGLDSFRIKADSIHTRRVFPQNHEHTTGSKVCRRHALNNHLHQVTSRLPNRPRVLLAVFHAIVGEA